MFSFFKGIATCLGGCCLEGGMPGEYEASSGAHLSLPCSATKSLASFTKAIRSSLASGFNIYELLSFSSVVAAKPIEDTPVEQLHRQLLK